MNYYLSAPESGVFVLEIQRIDDDLELRQIERLNTYYQALSLSLERRHIEGIFFTCVDT